MSPALPAERLPPPWRDEGQAAAALRTQLSGLLDWSAVREHCTPWVHGVRHHPGPPWALESLLHEFPLNTQEGLGLMRLAEALLRVPDAETALALTADQLKGSAAAGAAAPHEQGLVANLTHRVLALGQALLPAVDQSPQGWVQRLGSPTVVAATVRAVQLLGQQFVLGQDIDEALERARRMQANKPTQRLCFSFDMLGEGARSWEDANRYHQAYRHALEQLAGQAALKTPGPHGGQPLSGNGLSIKLSALHPRLEIAHAHEVTAQLIPRLVELCHLAAQSRLQLTLDAEESWRLELQLHLLANLLEHLSARGQDAPWLSAWQGLGLAIQAYQHRALPSIDAVIALARQHGRRLTVRLVKGAYWDSELKRAQELGLPGFPVYTHKTHTDLSYLACAQRLLTQHEHVLPQFATHNAATVAAVMQLARRAGVPHERIEWQRLHGMGEATWREILSASQAHADQAEHTTPLRVYAPVGSHKELLAYLVRRLLENGANASFVHQLADPNVPPERLLASPLLDEPDYPGSAGTIAPPRTLDGQGRLNAWGRDVQHAPHREALSAALAGARYRQQDTPTVALPSDIDLIMTRLHAALPDWEARGSSRCQPLETVATRLEQELDSWAADLVLEGGKCWPDAVSEVRETIDYARYYAHQARDWLRPRTMPGPTGEHNEWRLRARGVWVCIAPWNFPLAIFGGQVMAALVMGNTVAAKPAEQTPRIAQRFTHALLDAGVAPHALCCLPGEGATIGAALVQHPLCAGVAFTGSVPTGLALQRMLCDRGQGRLHAIVPLIAETGGLNALIADSTALPEQLLDSVLASAFGSAGQRCSALRLLCVHTAVAEAFEQLLSGALQTLVVGDPAQWQTDLGPVIDERARQRLLTHLQALASEAEREGSGVSLIGRAHAPSPEAAGNWPFVTPSAWRLPRVAALTDEHFGPVLHVVRWGPGCSAESLDALIDQINATGFGLTLGVHTRIDARAEHVARRARVGNVYVNRGITGAVVGSQPFGGQGLSGTGPKAGGPLYLPRFATEQVVCINTAAAGGDAALLTNPLTR